MIDVTNGTIERSGGFSREGVLLVVLAGCPLRLCHPAWPVAWKSLPGRKTKTTTTKPEQQQQTKTKRDHGRTGEGDDRGLVHPLIPSPLLHQLLGFPLAQRKSYSKRFHQSINQSSIVSTCPSPCSLLSINRQGFHAQTHSLFQSQRHQRTTLAYNIDIRRHHRFRPSNLSIIHIFE